MLHKSIVQSMSDMRDKVYSLHYLSTCMIYNYDKLRITSLYLSYYSVKRF